MLLFQQTHVVHDHHASGVSALQLHCYCNLEEEDDTETFFSLAFLQLVQENSLKKKKKIKKNSSAFNHSFTKHFIQKINKPTRMHTHLKGWN